MNWKVANSVTGDIMTAGNGCSIMKSKKNKLAAGKGLGKCIRPTQNDNLAEQVQVKGAAIRNVDCMIDRMNTYMYI